MTQDDSQATPEERALDALRQRMARPQPRAQDEQPEEMDAEESGAGFGSATGFVGMLAKRHLDGDPPAAGGIEAEAARRIYPLHMAREISPPVGQELPSVPPPASLPGWYRLAVPAAAALAGLLFLIGIWAIGALAYMRMHNGSSHPPVMTPGDVHYPLIAWSYNAGPLGDYTAFSRMMPLLMLACLPVGGLLIVMAAIIRGRISMARKG